MVVIANPPFLRCLQNLADRLGESFPVRRLDGELFAPRAGQFVILGATIVFRSAPLGLDPALLLHSVERRVERAFFDLQYVFGRLLNPLRDFVTVERAARERLENQHRQCALKQVRFRLSHNSFPLDWPGKDTRGPPRLSREQRNRGAWGGEKGKEGRRGKKILFAPPALFASPRFLQKQKAELTRRSADYLKTVRSISQ